MLNSARQLKAPSVTPPGLGLPALELSETVVFGIPAIEAAKVSAASQSTEDQQIAQSLYNLAAAQFDRKNYPEAENLLASALSVVKRVYGEKHLAVAEIFSNMAVIRLRQDDPESAESLLHRAILIVQEYNGAEIELARAFNNLGAVYHKQSNYSDAEECFREALTIMERTLLEETGTAEHPELLPILQNYAALLTATGRQPDASPFQARINRIKRKTS